MDKYKAKFTESTDTAKEARENTLERIKYNFPQYKNVCIYRTQRHELYAFTGEVTGECEYDVYFTFEK